MQGPRLYLRYEPGDRFTAPAGVMQLKPVAELDLGEVLLGEQHGHPLPGRAADNDHFGIRGGAQETIMREHVSRLRAVADRTDGRRSCPRLSWLSDESQGFRILASGQQLRFAARERYPLLVEGRLNLDALRLEPGSRIWI